jgi:hypothetical protein
VQITMIIDDDMPAGVDVLCRETAEAVTYYVRDGQPLDRALALMTAVRGA